MTAWAAVTQPAVGGDTPRRQVVYIAGPMTGKLHYNVSAFRHAAAQWHDAGWDVITPFESNSVVWARHFNRPFDPYHDACDYGDPIMGELVGEDFAALARADAVALIEGWRQSRGAGAEALVAFNLRKPLYDGATFDRMTDVPSLTWTNPDETILQEAQRLVHGNRGADYGHPIEDYTRTGRIWGALLGIPDIDPRICTLMMAGVKMSRDVHKSKRDNRTDMAGYAECAQMIADEQTRRAPLTVAEIVKAVGAIVAGAPEEPRRSIRIVRDTPTIATPSGIPVPNGDAA